MPRDNINQRTVPVDQPLRPGAMTELAGEINKNGKKNSNKGSVPPVTYAGKSNTVNVSKIGQETSNDKNMNPEEKAEFGKYGFDNDSSTEGKEVSQGKMTKGSQPMDKPVGSLVAKAAKSRVGISFKQNVRK